MPLRFNPDALAAGISSDDARLLLDKIAWVWANRTVVRHTPLKANLAGFYKRAKGNFRIIYTYDNPTDEMIVHLVDRRANVYKEMGKRTG
jgi:mRNA-degrading endonuclease RelE of RelBE toxin-antitoxin system